MIHKVKLKNSDKEALVSNDAFNYFSSSELYASLAFLSNMRLHSSGYAFYQKNFPLEEGGYRNLTIYLHKAVAEQYVPKPAGNQKLFVRFKNGNTLDCHEDNLEWVTMAELRRKQKNHSNVTGYRGVVKVSKHKYRAVIYKDRNRFDLGLYASAEEAAQAYNEKSRQLFGTTDSLNTV